MHFPNGKPLSPSLKMFLSIDASWLGEKYQWFDNLNDYNFSPRSLTKFAEDEYPGWGSAFTHLESIFCEDLYWLPLGADSRRALYVGEPDSYGEYPVLYIEADCPCHVSLCHPGFDVYMAELVGLIDLDDRVSTSHTVYGDRTIEHIEKNIKGKKSWNSYGSHDNFEPF